jgi:hypothetical protein
LNHLSTTLLSTIDIKCHITTAIGTTLYLLPLNSRSLPSTMFASPGSQQFNNCLVCLLKSRCDIFRLIFPVTGTCQHSSTSKPPRAYYRISRPVIWLDVLLITFLAASCVKCFIDLPQIYRTDKTLSLILLSDQILVMVSTVSGFLKLLSMKVQIIEFNAWIATIDRRRFYGVKHILTEQKANKFIFFRDVSIIMTSLSWIVGLALIFGMPYDNLPGHWYRKLLLILCYCYQSYITQDMTYRIKLVGVILNAFKKSLTKKSYPIFALKRRELTLGRTLKKYTNFILVIHMNIHLFKRHMSSIIILYFLTVVASLIVNIYVLIEFNDYNIYTLLVIQMRVVIMVASTVFVFVTAENSLKNKVSGEKVGPQLDPCGTFLPRCFVLTSLLNQVMTSPSLQ